MPAYNTFPVKAIASALTSRGRRLWLNGRQVAPASTLLKMPPAMTLMSPLEAAAYSVDGVTGSMVNVSISRLVKPAFVIIQLTPPSLLLNTPPPPPAAA